MVTGYRPNVSLNKCLFLASSLSIKCFKVNTTFEEKSIVFKVVDVLTNLTLYKPCNGQ